MATGYWTEGKIVNGTNVGGGANGYNNSDANGGAGGTGVAIVTEIYY